MGGYNTMCEILTLQKRALIVPRVRPVTEQWIRTRRMEALGLVDMIHPEQLTAENFARQITRVLFEAPPVPDSSAWRVLGSDGLPAVSRFVAAQMRARRSS